MDRKRAHEAGSGEGGSAVKKFKSDTTGLAQDLIAQKRAEIAAKLAAMRGGGVGAGGIAVPKPITPSPSTSSILANATVSSGPTPPTPSASAPKGISEDLARKVAEAKRKVAEAQSQLSVRDNPYMSIPSKRSTPASATSGRGTPASAPAAGDAPQGVGLNMAAHPLLLSSTPTVLNQSKKDRYKPMVPKFASIKANVRNAPTPTPAVAPPPPVSSPAILNPYMAASASLEGSPAPGPSGTPTPAASTQQQQALPNFDSAPAPHARIGRSFRFNPKGKYVALGNQMRQEVQLEELKKRIAESAKKAGMDVGEGLEKSVKRAPPPDVEWWDTSLVPASLNPSSSSSLKGQEHGHAHAPLDLGDPAHFEVFRKNLCDPNSPITIYVQHPIPIPAPGEKGVGLKPLMLTTKEQKKMRKLRRKQEQQDKRDRIKMGLLPPDPPKVRLANLMKVLTSDAVQDPTRVEARVRREVAMRKHGHEKMNAERKLTDEQRREKLENKKLEAEKSGIWGAVFKIKTLTDPSHQFKVRKNAEQFALTGLCIFNPTFNLVYVEGAQKFMKKYKRLLLQRIAWTEAARPRGAEEVELENLDSDVEGDDATKPSAPTGQEGGSGGKDSKEGEKESLENNTCHLVWEGVIRDRVFNNFRCKTCPTDREAKDVLGEKMKGYWDLARSWKGEEEELF